MLEAQRDALLTLIASWESCAVAFSAGVDSTVVAKAAQLALGVRAVAVTGSSASLPAGELEAARQLAAQIGIRHHVLATEEFARAAYTRNAPDRCYHCKTELYTQIARIQHELGVQVVANGVNRDDLDDYRPGLQAAREHEIRSPLAECGFDKHQVRALARHWQLPVWDKPASPCLSSRVAYGEQVTPERLAMIDAAERQLRARGLPVVRVRWHAGDLARVEVPREELAHFLAADLAGSVVAALRALGFKFVTLDLEGFRSGSLNRLIELSLPAAVSDTSPTGEHLPRRG